MSVREKDSKATDERRLSRPICVDVHAIRMGGKMGEK